MANKLRTPKLSIIGKLKNEPYRFSFEQAVFILKKTYPNYKIAFRSASRNYLCGNELESINIKEDQIDVISDRMSFTSLNAPLPDTFIETIKTFSWNKDESLPDFINIFYNRLAKISYRISVKININLESDKRLNSSLIDNCLNTFSGEKIFYLAKYAYLFWNKPHTSLGLRSLLSDYFKCDINIKEFAGQFYPIEEISYLGIKNNKLGESCVLGQSFFEYGSKIKISFYNLSKELFLEFKENSNLRKEAEYLIKKYVGQLIDYDLEFIPIDTIETKLDSQSILGYSSWLKSI